MIDYRPLRPEHADDLVELVSHCYGDTYPVSMLYDADLLQQHLNSGALISAGAFTADDALVGHVGMYWAYPTETTPNSVTAVIREDCQRQGILGRLTKFLGTLIPDKPLVGIHSFAVTTHTASQRNGLDSGSFETGFLIPHCPATLQARGIAAVDLGESIPSIALYTPLLSAPSRSCYLPADYHAVVQQIYQRIGYHRSLSDRAATAEGVTQCDRQYDQRRRITTMDLQHIGTDWPEVTETLRESAQNSDASQGWYIDIPLNQPAAIAVTESLREEGWCFGCVLFERNQVGDVGDVLRMQFSKARINRDALSMATDFSRQLMHFVLDERDARSI